MQRLSYTCSLRWPGLAGLLAVIGIAPAFAQDAQSPAPNWRSFVTVTPWFQGDAGLDGGGDFRAAGALFRAGVSTTLGDGHRAGLTLSYDYIDYRFSSPAAFGGVAPWGEVQRIGLGAPIVFQGTNGWSYLLTPSVDLSREDGADTGEAFGYGAVIAVSKRFDRDRRIGLGIGVFDRLEELSILPFIVVDWKLTERLRLVNPVAAGPTGGAGLELSYRLDDNWTIGTGGAYRSTRFRLNEEGPFPDGIGEERGVVAFVHADRRFGRVRLDLYAGAVLAGRLKVEDADGDTLVKEDFDPAPLLGASVSLEF